MLFFRSVNPPQVVLAPNTVWGLQYIVQGIQKSTELFENVALLW